MKEEIFRKPDLSNRKHRLEVKKVMQRDSGVLFKAWTQEFQKWFAAPCSVIMRGKINTTYFFETDFKFEESEKAQREPHYGRFLKIIENELIEMTWVTGPNGTKGAETIVKVELVPSKNGTELKLGHSGFLDEESKEQHEKAWPEVLKQMDDKYSNY